MVSHEVHALEPGRFLEEVHSFQFWFHSVSGYLGNTTFGHRPEAAEVVLPEREREQLVTILCNYCIGETAALEGASGLIGFAPNRMSKIFLATQVADEGRHVEVFLHRLRELGVRDPELEAERRANPNLLEFKRRLLELVARHDWEAALFAQNVILEAMEFTVFDTHARTADPITREILEGIVKDERRHIGFGENSLGRMLQVSPDLSFRLRTVKRDLDHLILATFREAMSQVAGTTRGDLEIELGRTYLATSRRLGLA